MWALLRSSLRTCCPGLSGPQGAGGECLARLRADAATGVSNLPGCPAAQDLTPLHNLLWETVKKGPDHPSYAVPVGADPCRNSAGCGRHAGGSRAGAPLLALSWVATAAVPWSCAWLPVPSGNTAPVSQRAGAYALIPAAPANVWVRLPCVVQKLKEIGEWDNTYILYTAE